MIVEKNFVRASDGHEIYYVMYKPENPVRHVHLMHGMAEHIGRYEQFARYLVSQGIAVSGHDHRGHGRTAQRNGTPGSFADHDGFSRVVDDARQVIAHARTEIGDVPFVLFGHSMGSFVARRIIQLKSDDLAAVVLSGTAGNPGPMGKAGLLLARASAKWSGKLENNPTLTKLTFGNFNKDFLDEGSEFAWLSTDTQQVEDYLNDPLCGFPMTNQFYVDLFSGIGLINRKDQIARIEKDLPIILVSGSDDAVGDRGKGVMLTANQYRAAGIEHVTVYLAEEKRHELLHETAKEQLYGMLYRWLVKYG